MKVIKIVAGLALLMFSLVVLVIGIGMAQGEPDVIRVVCIMAAVIATPGLLLILWAGVSRRTLLPIGIVAAVLIGLFAVAC